MKIHECYMQLSTYLYAVNTTFGRSTSANIRDEISRSHSSLFKSEPGELMLIREGLQRMMEK